MAHDGGGGGCCDRDDDNHYSEDNEYEVVEVTTMKVMVRVVAMATTIRTVMTDNYDDSSSNEGGVGWK